MRHLGKTICAIAAAAIIASCGASAENNHAQPSGGHAMKIRISIENKQILATLDDNPTARDFAALLPLTLTLEDYNNTEKVSSLPRALTKEDAPSAVTPKIGDIAFYAPWGNLAVFYRDFGRSPGLIKLGRIESGIDALSAPGPLKATVELISKQGE